VTFELHQDDTFWRESRVREASSMKPNDNVSSKKLMGHFAWRLFLKVAARLEVDACLLKRLGEDPQTGICKPAIRGCCRFFCFWYWTNNKESARRCCF